MVACGADGGPAALLTEALGEKGSSTSSTTCMMVGPQACAWIHKLVLIPITLGVEIQAQQLKVEKAIPGCQPAKF